jgi:hypothetical protein
MDIVVGFVAWSFYPHKKESLGWLQSQPECCRDKEFYPSWKSRSNSFIIQFIV